MLERPGMGFVNPIQPGDNDVGRYQRHRSGDRMDANMKLKKESCRKIKPGKGIGRMEQRGSATVANHREWAVLTAQR